MKNSNAQKHPQVTPEAVNVTSRLTHPSGTHRCSVQVSVLSAELQPKQAEEPGEMFSHRSLGVGGSTLWIDPCVDSKIYKLKCLPSAATCLCYRLWNNYQGH